jgi:DNA-binding NtrC family response regulator
MPDNAAPLRVLVVDDEMLIRWSLSETLQHDGHVVSEAGSAAQAMEQIACISPDVVLLDYRLPDSNDLSLLATIRRLSPGSAVVMMTAYGGQSMESAALEMGAFRVLGKPLDMLDVGRIVREAFESAH